VLRMNSSRKRRNSVNIGSDAGLCGSVPGSSPDSTGNGNGREHEDEQARQNQEMEA
jgi:hypothetical protein